MSQILDEQMAKYNSGYYYRSQSSLRDNYNVTLEKGEDGMVVAKCPDLSVITQGKTYEKAAQNAVEAIELVLEELGKTKEFSISVHRLS